MSEFSKILQAKGFDTHTQKALWEYGLNDDEFYSLKESLSETHSLTHVDPRDCALYYAEWWRRLYESGSPSKKQVFDSVFKGKLFNENDFYETAKRGARLLGIKWIKHQRTWYLRTLLLQGGLPITHITQNSGSYKRFLLRILDLNPSSIADFAFDSSITCILPRTCQNDDIYECCLEIVRSIIDEDKQIVNENRKLVEILDGNQALQDIGNELRVRKQTIQQRRKSKVKCTWMLNPEKKRIRLYLGIPEDIDRKVFCNLFLDNRDVIPDYEYKLFVNDDLVCKFKKKANEDYRTIWLNQSDIQWDGREHLPEIYLIDAQGEKKSRWHLITHLPSLTEPSLWTKYSDVEWVLEKGTHTSQKDANILSPVGFNVQPLIDATSITICNQELTWTAFEGSITFTNGNEICNFQTDCPKIDWYIDEDRPAWVKTANYPIVRGKPKVYVYNPEGDLIHNATLHWKQKNGAIWNNWSAGALPPGLIEIKIVVGQIIEFDRIFNISGFNLLKSSTDIHQAEIELNQNQFHVQVSEDDFVQITKLNSDRFQAQLKNNYCVPKSLQISLRYGNQASSLRCEMFPPFNGVAILDKDGKMIPEEHCFEIGNLNGYRLMSNSRSTVVNIYNSSRPSIIVTKSLNDTYAALREFEDKIQQLASLSDPIRNNTEIVFELCDNSFANQKKLKEYRFKKYGNHINWSLDEGCKVVIKTDSQEQVDLYAIPVDGSLKDLALYDLVYDGESYKFRDGINFENFVVFSSREGNASVQPAVICATPIVEVENENVDAVADVNYKQQLLEGEHQSEVWQKFLYYYKICTQNNLPYSTFEVLKTMAGSSEIAAKAYVLLTCHDENSEFVEQHYKTMEDDIGFAFHWINKQDWGRAMEWIGCFGEHKLRDFVMEAIKDHFKHLRPYSGFEQTSNFILQDARPPLYNDFHLNTKIYNVRMSMGARVLNELPEKCPKILEQFKYILKVTKENSKVKILLKSPLAIALSITGIDNEMWKENGEDIRRYVKYAQLLNPEWYSEAINYSLSKLNA